jgi:hypothetical protein
VAVVLGVLVLSSCAGKQKPDAPKEPGPPEPVASLHSLRWEVSADSRSVTLFATGEVGSTGYAEPALSPRPRVQAGVREFNFSARPPAEGVQAASRPRAVEAFLTFSMRAAERMTGVRVYTSDAVLELPLEPALNAKPTPVSEVPLRLAIVGQTPAAYVGKAVYTPAGFRAFAAKNLGPSRLGVGLRVEAGAAVDVRAVEAFGIGRIDVPIRFQVTDGDSFDSGELGDDAKNPLRLVVVLSRVNERTVATVRAAEGEGGALAGDLQAGLVDVLRDRINERPTVVDLIAGAGVGFGDWVAVGTACRAAGAKVVRPGSAQPVAR